MPRQEKKKKKKPRPIPSPPPPSHFPCLSTTSVLDFSGCFPFWWADILELYYLPFFFFSFFLNAAEMFLHCSYSPTHTAWHLHWNRWMAGEGCFTTKMSISQLFAKLGLFSLVLFLFLSPLHTAMAITACTESITANRLHTSTDLGFQGSHFKWLGVCKDVLVWRFETWASSFLYCSSCISWFKCIRWVFLVFFISFLNCLFLPLPPLFPPPPCAPSSFLILYPHPPSPIPFDLTPLLPTFALQRRRTNTKFLSPRCAQCTRGKC